jgi:hypothetical protein
MRSFDPHAVGTLEARAWEYYYLRRWIPCLFTFVRLVRAGFKMPWRRVLVGAWWVLRANQQWAPFPDNDPDAAVRSMERFYRLVVNTYSESFDPLRAATLEVAWWRAHREVQYGDSGALFASLVQALSAQYSFAYGAPAESVRPAVVLRAEAMMISDRWVAEGCSPNSPLLDEERMLLVRSYASLLSVVHR